VKRTGLVLLLGAVLALALVGCSKAATTPAPSPAPATATSSVEPTASEDATEPVINSIVDLGNPGGVSRKDQTLYAIACETRFSAREASASVVAVEKLLDAEHLAGYFVTVPSSAFPELRRLTGFAAFWGRTIPASFSFFEMTSIAEFYETEAHATENLAFVRTVYPNAAVRKVAITTTQPIYVVEDGVAQDPQQFAPTYAPKVYAKAMGGSSHKGQTLYLIVGATEPDLVRARRRLDWALVRFGDMETYYVIARSDSYTGLASGSWIVSEAYKVEANAKKAENLELASRFSAAPVVRKVTAKTADPVPVYEELVPQN
jgi:hypothetical protein